MKNKIKKEIFCTLGPSTLNKDFLKFTNQKISLLRLNLSHVDVSALKFTIKFIRKYTKVPICIDTEGAQIRTRVNKIKKLNEGSNLIINKKAKDFYLYPPEVYAQLKKNDVLLIGFKDLQIKIISKRKEKIVSRVIKSGILENAQGVHLKNRKIRLNFITNKQRNFFQQLLCIKLHC